MILKSATKITLLGFVVVICASTLAIVFNNLSNEAMIAGVFGIFTTTAGMVFGYYFRKSQEKENVNPGTGL